jgi:hypothetical protein
VVGATGCWCVLGCWEGIAHKEGGKEISPRAPYPPPPPPPPPPKSRRRRGGGGSGYFGEEDDRLPEGEEAGCCDSTDDEARPYDGPFAVGGEGEGSSFDSSASGASGAFGMGMGMGMGEEGAASEDVADFLHRVYRYGGLYRGDCVCVWRGGGGLLEGGRIVIDGFGRGEYRGTQFI